MKPTSPSLRPGVVARTAALLLCVVMGSGCSWTFVFRGPDEPRPNDRAVPCTESPIPPHLDVAMAVIYPAAAVLRLALGDVEVTDDTTGETTINEAPPAALLLGASAAVAAGFLALRVDRIPSDRALPGDSSRGFRAARS